MRLKKLRKSFLYAWRGIRTVAREEQNFRIQLIAACLVFVAAAMVQVRPTDAAILVLVTALVLVLELTNSVVERMLDALKPRIHPFVGDVKNIAAGAVMIAAVGAIIVALFVFYPYVA